LSITIAAAWGTVSGLAAFSIFVRTMTAKNFRSRQKIQDERFRMKCGEIAGAIITVWLSTGHRGVHVKRHPRQCSARKNPNAKRDCEKLHHRDALRLHVLPRTDGITSICGRSYSENSHGRASALAGHLTLFDI
jgi:hypothetical protein